jgi:GAF domain-containing protein
MRIVVEQGEAVLFDQNFTGGTLYVGRHEQCQVKLPGDDKIAARHLVIFEENGEWFVNTLHDQYQTTQLNGQVFQGRRELAADTELTLANYRIKCLFEEKEDEDRIVPFQIIARGNADLQETAAYAPAQMNLPETVIIKKRTDTFSLSKGRLEYLSSLTLKMLEAPDVRGLVSMVIDALLADMQACCVWIGLRADSEGHLHLSAGKDLSGRPVDAPATARKFTYATVECARSLILQAMENNPDRSCLTSPLVSPDGSLGMVYLESDPEKPRFTPSDLDTLVFICNQMAIAIDRLLRREKEQIGRILSIDQELARKVQSRTAPWKLPQWPELQLAVLAEPGTGACTDFYDVVPLGDKQAMMLLGQTAPGTSDTAICIAEMSASFRIGAVHRDAPQVLMRQINWLLFATAGEPRKITAGLVSIDPQSGEFCICLAGNVHAFLVGTTGKVVKIKTPANPLVGEFRVSKYEAVNGKLGSEQTLVLCTGGIFGVASGKGGLFNEGHLVEFLSDSLGQIPARVLSDLADDITAFTGGKKPQHDITLLLLRKGRSIG